MTVTRATQRGSASTAVRRSLGEVREHLAATDRETLKAADSSGHHLGMVLNLATAYRPSCIVLGDSVIELGAPFLQPALDVLDAHATFGGSRRPKVRTSRFGQNARCHWRGCAGSLPPDRRLRRLTPSYNEPVPLSSRSINLYHSLSTTFAEQ
ncbi:hypothetical protein ASC95_23550 [Pelomonas sp. Root1217]|nr:hypothetical protein ASC95_23550 [Pelomonas sp. Root1217]